MWKVVDKTSSLNPTNNAIVTPRQAMKGTKIRMKEYLRTQLLKSKYAYNCTTVRQ